MVEATLVSAAVLVVVSAISFVLFAVVFAAQRRSGNPKLLLVSLAFLVFFLKGAFVSAVLFLHWLPHDVLWGFDATFDLLAFGLLASPLLVRR